MSKPRRLPSAEQVAESVTITWNPLAAGYLAHCDRCAESATAHRYGWLAAWADTHTCDPELAALLALLDLDGRAA